MDRPAVGCRPIGRRGEAAEYLAGVTERFPKALELQCVPEDPALWQIESYEKFLQARRALLADHLNEFLDKITSSETVITPITLEQQIAEGESDGLEFKATLRWDLVEQTVNKKLEEVVLKTVAAFANSQGGTLLVGVDDDGEIVGLEHDYAALGGVDRDKFELHLRNLLNQEFGTGFVATAVRVSFPEIAGQEICRVVVLPASDPVIVKAKSKDGVITEKFYVRSGNSSQEIPVSELKAYWSKRFAS